MIRKVCFLLMLCQLSFIGLSYAQQAATTTKGVQVNNEKYIVHKIAKGETIFSICKKYNIDQKELIAANPSLADGLKTGQTLNIPKKEVTKKGKEKKEKKEEYLSHTVKKGETLFSIAQKYNLSIETIVKFNPAAKDGVKTDQVLKIPGFVEEADANDQSKVKKETAKTEVIDYEVEDGDTFFGLLRKFGVTKEELLRINPGIQPDIKVGQIVKIPKKEAGSSNNSPQNKYIEHKVEPGETIFGLSTEYDVKVFEIMEINPGLEEKGLVAGQTVFIPRLPDGKTEGSIKKDPKPDAKELKNIQQSAKAKQTVTLARDTFRITMFLPLFLSQNFSDDSGADDEGTDSTAIGDNSRKERSLYSHSRNFLSFYEGFLIALDTMKKTGINIVVDLYDNEGKQAAVDAAMRKPKLADADLIVGPVDVKHQKSISNFSYKNQIPLVSPLSSDDDYLSSNPFYFQVKPTKDYIYRKTADFIGREFWNKNVIVMTPYSYEQIQGGDIVELVREKLRSNSAKNGGGSVKFSKVSIGQGYWEAKDNLRQDVENVVFILPPSNKAEREAIFSRAINSLYVLSEDYDITVVGMEEYLNYKSINYEYYHKLNLHYLTPNFIDYTEPEVNAFIGAYRKKFFTEPNQFSYRGYDVAKYFLEAYRTNGRSYLNKISSLQINTLQSNFKMKRVKEFSGFMNRSLFVVNFTPEYELKAVSTVSD